MNRLNCLIAVWCIIVSVVTAHSRFAPQRVFTPAEFRTRLLDSTPGGYDEPYGYPHTIGGLIIEGPFPYKNGPSVWSDDNRWGAYGLIAAPGQYFANHTCSVVPQDSPFSNSVLEPIHLEKLKSCEIGCNLTKVKETGIDDCHIGSTSSPVSNSVMSCWDIGSYTESGFGVCAYNCSAFQPNTEKLVPCSQADVGAGNCFIYCDSRTFPTENSSGLV